jgi:hypothetical protein
MGKVQTREGAVQDGPAEVMRRIGKKLRTICLATSAAAK